jgi:hypothetical protein
MASDGDDVDFHATSDSATARPSSSARTGASISSMSPASRGAVGVTVVGVTRSAIRCISQETGSKVRIPSRW